jgi:hypothetical protein
MRVFADAFIEQRLCNGREPANAVVVQIRFINTDDTIKMLLVFVITHNDSCAKGNLSPRLWRVLYDDGGFQAPLNFKDPLAIRWRSCFRIQFRYFLLEFGYSLPREVILRAGGQCGGNFTGGTSGCSSNSRVKALLMNSIYTRMAPRKNELSRTKSRLTIANNGVKLFSMLLNMRAKELNKGRALQPENVEPAQRRCS